MGTNYYLKRIPTQEEIDKTKQLLDERKIESHAGRWNWSLEEDPTVEDMIHEMTKEIHIGKQSGGWQFCFRTNDEYGQSYKEVFDFILNAIRSMKWKFIDEYGEVVNYDKFVNMVYNNKNEWNIFTYPEHCFFDVFDHDKTDSVSEDGSWWCNVDFS